MKFLKKTIEEATIKIYTCPVCNYTVEVVCEGGSEVKTVGDDDFILFPFTSLAALDRTTKELCACPKCNTIQYVDRVEEEVLDSNGNRMYIN